MIGGYIDAGAVVVDQELAAVVWEAFGPGMRATFPHLSAEVQDQVRRHLVALQAAHRAAATSGSGSAEGQISGPVVSSSHEIPAVEAAAMIGVSRRRVGQMCDEGVLEGRLVAGRRVVTESSVAAEITRRETGAA